MEQSTKTEITPLELKRRLDSGEQVFILDIREPNERLLCKLPDSAHIPMGEVPQKLPDLEGQRNKDIVVYCRSGGRSARVVAFLTGQGFARAINLTGGILRWADEVDPSISKY